MIPSAALAAVLVDELCRAGLVHAVMAPGSRSAPLALALYRDTRMSVHVVIDERSAAFMALGIARATRAPALVLCTSGTAAANFHPAVIEAEQARVPLLVVSADRPEELRATGANQTIDQTRLYGGAVRFFAEIAAPHDSSGEEAPRWRSVVGQAYAAATGPPPGPVHLNVAFREPLVEPGGEPADAAAGPRPGGRSWTETIVAARRPSNELASRLAGEIAAIERGLIVAGDCDLDPVPVVELAERTGWPLLAEPTSGARRGRQAITTFDALLRHAPFVAAHRPELVLRFGKPSLSRALARLLSSEVPQVLIDRDGARLDPERALSRIVATDEALLCGALCERLEPRGESAWLRSWQESEKAARTAIDDLLDGDDSPSEPRAARDLAALVPNGDVLVAASSMPIRDLNSFMAARPGLRVLGNRGASGIDGFVSSAVGIALVSPSRTYALAGDLSLLHDQNGLIDRTNANLALVVLNNDGGGIFSLLPQAGLAGFEELFGTPHGVDLSTLARLYGLEYRRVERAGDLDAAISGEGLTLIEIRTQREANARLHHRLWSAVAVALEG
ncbi:MAG: 2-succinyl-5-enolpyruvyl-6-hydroxy-3-cyclohexene-1-carboxylic-acid synthase [Actinomycetota bacterium]